MSAQLHAPGRLKTFYGLNVRFTFSWEEDMNVIELCVGLRSTRGTNFSPTSSPRHGSS